jgi:uncharacterized protein YoxC
MAALRQAKAAIYAALRARMPGAQAQHLAEVIDNLKQDVDAINTATNNLVTAVNTLATKLNADAGVTDTNYVTNNAQSGV